MLKNVKYLYPLIFLSLLISISQASAASQQSINVIDDQVFFAFGPSVEELDQALVGNYPEWANYEQNVSWYSEPVKLSKIVREASFQEKFALNSAVTLVTLGESRGWQLPSDGDVFLESLTISERLHHLWFEWTNPENEEIRAQFPEITNAATYAMYRYFNGDLSRLEDWCRTYVRIYGESPLKTLDKQKLTFKPVDAIPEI